MNTDNPTIGVLALQGAVTPHKPHIEAAGGIFKAVKTTEDFESVDGFILPGGESTTMLNLIDRFGLWEALHAQFTSKPVWGICAGAILLAETVYIGSSSPRRANARSNGGDPAKESRKAAHPVDSGRASASTEARQRNDDGLKQKSFALLPMTILRNGYGRQLDSHFAEIDGYTVSFIRAPVIQSVHGAAEILAEHQGTPVWVKSGHVMASTFHPELTRDTPSPMHKMFIESINAIKN